MKNSRRFSDEQIKSMETIFKVEAKLEPKKKLQMARELGLQPRQVAIWLQKKRARWKPKQIEHEFRSLKADYDELSLRFESLKKEKHSLLIQLQKLRDQLNLSGEGHNETKDMEGINSTNSCSENGELKFQLKANKSKHMYSDDHFAEREGAEFCSLSTKLVDGFPEATEKLSGSELDDGLYDQPCATPTSTWWDFRS